MAAGTNAGRSLELQALLDATVDAVIIIDHQGHIELFNRSAERLFGYSAAEVLGHNVNVLMTSADRDSHDAYMARYIETGVPHIIGTGREVDAQRKDGTVFPAFLSVGRIQQSDPPRFVGFLQDITQRRAIEQSMERTRVLLQEAQSIARIGNYEFYPAESARHASAAPDDHTSRRTDDYWSPEMYSIFGVDPKRARLDFERISDLVHPDDRDRYEQIWHQTFAESGTSSFDYRIVRPDGQVRHLHSRQQVTHQSDGRRRVAGTVLDVTERKRAEEQTRQAQERMMHVSRLATMGEMAAGIAHELNQPLAAITTYAQASMRLLNTPHPELTEVGDALKQIAAQSLRAGEIIRRLRSLVRSSETPREPAAINDEIEEVSALTATDARMHDVRLTLQLAPDLPQVRIDRIQIQQVLLNLLRNAIEALDSVAPEAREIQVRTQVVENGDVEVSVCDSGPGVAGDIVDRMFHPFSTTKPSGTGLGLAISRTIIQAHQGELGYRVGKPQGACFFFRLPVAQGSEQQS